MPPEPTTNQSQYAPSSSIHGVDEGEKQNKQLDREVRNMVNAITQHVGDLHSKAGGASLRQRQQQQQQDVDEDERGVRIITLAGTNTGATMRSDLDEKLINNNPHGMDHDEPDALGTYVNSNFQAVNNSIMLGSNYNTNDPGVHLDISDVYEHHCGHGPDHKHGKKGKKKGKETPKSDHHSD